VSTSEEFPGVRASARKVYDVRIELLTINNIKHILPPLGCAYVCIPKSG